MIVDILKHNLLEQYINGNILEVKECISEVYNGVYDGKEVNFSVLFNFYVDEYNPSREDLKLFVSRLT